MNCAKYLVYVWSLALTLTGLLYVYPIKPYIEPITGGHGFIPPVAERGQLIQIKRHYIVYKKVEVKITRRFERMFNGHLEIYQLDSVQKVRTPGKFAQLRSFRVPKDIALGKWEMANTVCYQILFRDRCYNTPRCLWVHARTITQGHCGMDQDPH